MIFCDFLCNLQESGNQFNYWSSPFAMRTLERFLRLQCSPRGAAGAASVKFRRARRQTWPAKDGGGSRGALGFDLRVWTGRRWLRRAARRRPGRGSRGGSCSGEAAASARYPAVVAALGHARGTVGAAGQGGGGTGERRAGGQ
jgi:hypothetical protein